MYYVIEPQTDDAPHVTLSRQTTVQDLMFIRGQLIDPAVTPTSMVIDAEMHHDTYPDLMDVGVALACTGKLRNVLDSAAVDNIQYIRAEIQEFGRPIPGEFYVMNIVGRVSALDRAASSFTECYGQAVRMKSLVIDPSKTYDLHVFRLHEYQAIVLIHANIVPAVLAAQLQGVLLTPANGWSDRHRF